MLSIVRNKPQDTIGPGTRVQDNTYAVSWLLESSMKILLFSPDAGISKRIVLRFDDTKCFARTDKLILFHFLHGYT